MSDDLDLRLFQLKTGTPLTRALVPSVSYFFIFKLRAGMGQTEDRRTKTDRRTRRVTV